MFGFEERREDMVNTQLLTRGVRDKRVLAAMRKVPREDFLPAHLHSAAYEDAALRIADGQFMVQPFVIALMIEALVLNGTEKVLQVGSGAGYLTAVLAEIADQVYAIEPDGHLAATAMASLTRISTNNVYLKHDPGTDAWLEQAPFDAILISGAISHIPLSLTDQLGARGRLVAPIGTDPRAQEIVRVLKDERGHCTREPLADVRFVPVIGERGIESETLAVAPRPRVIRSGIPGDASLPALITRFGESFDTLDEAPLDRLVERIGDRRLVLIGEASHGTSEFYRLRARITRHLIEKCGFNFVAVEADWPDAAHIDRYVRHQGVLSTEWETSARFPGWMWRNEEVREFVDWLYRWNGSRDATRRVGFHGLDIYSLYDSSRAVVDYLDTVDSELATIARQRYGCLSPWQADPAAYGHAALTGSYHSCERDAIAVLVDLYKVQQRHRDAAREPFFDAEQNARLVASAERYYRVMYYGSRASWNLRDAHMYETLQNLLEHYGSNSKAVVWAHNSHIGNAAATEMSERGEYNLGELTRRRWGDGCSLIGFGTDHGTVAAASDWDGNMEIKEVRPSHPQSHEHMFHLSNQRGLILPMGSEQDQGLMTELSRRRLERAIGVIYRPESELLSHYFEAELTRQFDEYIWLDETKAVTPLPAATVAGMPDTYPFGV